MRSEKTLSNLRNSLPFTELEDALPLLQQTVADTCGDPHEFSPIITCLF